MIRLGAAVTAAVGAGAIALSGCAAALREPPTLEVLARMDDGREPALASARELLGEADSRFARRPDVDEVRAAESLYLRTAAEDLAGIDGILGAVRAKAWLAEHEPSSKARDELARSAVQTAQWCGRRERRDVRCDYWLAIALGLQARERPSTLNSALDTMIPALTRALETDPELDNAGPERILAIVYARAPGWPLGPGDPDAAVDSARRAVARRGDFPPNLLALAEALRKNGDADGARDAWRRALEAARARDAEGDPDAADWIAEAERGLGL